MLDLLRPHLRTLARRALALGLALAVTAPAAAQFGEAAGFGEMMSPYFLRRDLQLFADGLDLDDGQTVIVESLYWDYEDSHAEGKERMLERLSGMREELKDLDRDKILEAVFAPFEDRAAEWDLMREHFLQNVRAILNREQLTEWPRFRRMLRREKEISKGRFSGEGVDLFHVLKMVPHDDSTPGLASLLEDYEAQLDVALMARERELRESRLAMMRSIRDENPEVSLAIYDRQIAARVAIRTTNDEFAEAVASILPEPTASDFRRIVRQRGYPRIYRPTAAQRLFTSAQALDLSPEVRLAVENLEATFLSEQAAMNATLLRLIQEYEPVESRYRASSFAMRASGRRAEKPTDPSRPEFRRRERLGRRYIAMLQELLTAEQFDSLEGSQRYLKGRAGAGATDKQLKMLEGRHPPLGVARPGGKKQD